MFLPGLFAGCVPYAFIVGGVILWTALLEVGDVLERGLRRALGHTQIQWDRETTWQLAYLGHAPARRALGGRAPAVNVDLVGWVRGLRACGEDVLRWAAEALARVLRPRVLERAYGPALAAWLDAPSPEQLETARAALSEVTEVEPVWLVLRSTLEAAAQEGPWAAENMARLLAEAVGHLPATGESPPEVRDALSADLIAQVLARDTTNGQGGL